MAMSDRAAWKSKTGFLLAALGSAIGLGNIWRFPYMAYRNGGGAFLVPYFVALFVVGIPLMMLEFGLGHHSRRALPQALGGIRPRFAWIGWWSVSFVMFGIVVYYAAVIAWCGNYVVFSVTQPWGAAENVNSYFSTDFLGYVEDDGTFPFCEEERTEDGKLNSVQFNFGQLRWPVLVSLALVWLVNWLITRQHLQKGVELANKIFIPLLIGLTVVLVVWSWGFDGADAGRKLYLTPDWDVAFQTKTWIDAFSQIFFTLSLGFGIMVAYSSYLPKKTDIPSSAFLAAMGNCAFSVFAAFAVFAAIGFLADKQDVDLAAMSAVERQATELETLKQEDPAAFEARKQEYEEVKNEHDKNQSFQTQTKTFGLIFKTYPAIITEMGPVAGRVFGLAFFISLVVAGISSSISIIEAFSASLNDQFGWQRSSIASALCIIGFFLGIVFCTQSALFWLDLVDHFITTYGLVLVAICEAIIVGWLFPAKRLRRHLDEYRDFRFGQYFGIVMRVLMTSVLLVTWIGLTQMHGAAVAVGLARFVILGSAIVLWVDEHWLDFNIRLLIPALLVFLLDQALLKEVKAPYEGYPWSAVN
jgi:NSS family neurotransmitter:Na+ symporter